MGKKAHEYQYREQGGKIDAVKVFGWKCDNCADTHVCIYVRFIPTPTILEDMPDAEPQVSALQLSEKAARSLLEQLSYEVDHPAPGAGGGFQIAEFEF